MKHLDMFSLNDSEGIIQNDARYAIISSFTYALLREGFTPEQLNELVFIVVNRRIGCMIQVLRWKLI